MAHQYPPPDQDVRRANAWGALILALISTLTITASILFEIAGIVDGTGLFGLGTIVAFLYSGWFTVPAAIIALFLSRQSRHSRSRLGRIARVAFTIAAGSLSLMVLLMVVFFTGMLTAS